MSNYIPDRWVVVEFDSEVGGPIKKVLAGWYGGFGGSDSWKLSSGITEVKEFDDRWEFLNHSGSIYICYKNAFGMSAYMGQIYAGWEEGQCDLYTVKIVEGYKK